MRIGLIADTHVTRRGRLWPQVFTAFDGVDAILHAGDVWSPELVDELGELAPVRVARGNGDAMVEDERFEERCVMRFGGVKVGMLHEFPSPAWQPADFVLDQARRRFGGDAPEVIVCGHTHIEAAHCLEGLLCVNPGSPTQPRNKSLRLGTIGFLHINEGHAWAELCQLTEAGIERISWLAAHPATTPGAVESARPVAPP